MSLESLTFAEHDRLLITPDVFSEQPRFEDILKAKLSFIETGADPTTCVALRPQIAGSWIRCRQMGIEPDRVCLNKEVAPEAYQRICDSNEYLVQTAQPLMHIIEDLHLSHDYIFELLDPSGIALHQLGDFQLHGFIAEHSIFNESTMGTNAHSLCMRHKTSYQVLGPEHYCFALHNLAACAAPILDEHDEVLGSLLLTQPLPALPWDSDYQKLLSHTLGLITSLASAIEYHLRFRKCLTLLRTIDAQKKRVAVSKVTRSSLGDVADITFDDIMGSSPAIQKAIKLAQRYALTKESILLTGESGTGKEYFAQAIHNATCADGPFMSINCAAIPPRLIESELFGYEGGSFTGAERGGKPGKIELAHGGTLFLDEIGDMPLELQATLLRVLENKRVMRLGGKGYRQVDFRVMVATNRDLYAMTTTAAFREDLFYRLSILTIALPPLRERPEDILLFARYFIDECRRKGYDGPSDFSPGALELIKAYHWPGNVRQLKNFIFSAYCAATGDLIKLDDLPAYFQDGANAADKAGSATEVTDVTDVTDVCDVTDACDAVGTASTEGATAFSRQAPSFEPMSLAKLEEQIIQRTLAETGGNIARCAELLKVSKATLYRKLKQCDLEQ